VSTARAFTLQTKKNTHTALVHSTRAQLRLLPLCSDSASVKVSLLDEGFDLARQRLLRLFRRAQNGEAGTRTAWVEAGSQSRPNPSCRCGQGAGGTCTLRAQASERWKAATHAPRARATVPRSFTCAAPPRSNLAWRPTRPRRPHRAAAAPGALALRPPSPSPMAGWVTVTTTRRASLRLSGRAACNHQKESIAASRACRASTIVTRAGLPSSCWRIGRALRRTTNAMSSATS